MKKPEGLIAARFKDGESMQEIAFSLGRSVEFVEEAIRAAMLAQKETK